MFPLKVSPKFNTCMCLPLVVENFLINFPYSLSLNKSFLCMHILFNGFLYVWLSLKSYNTLKLHRLPYKTMFSLSYLYLLSTTLKHIYIKKRSFEHEKITFLKGSHSCSRVAPFWKLIFHTITYPKSLLCTRSSFKVYAQISVVLN